MQTINLVCLYTRTVLNASLFSPTAAVDDNWISVKRYRTYHLKVGNDQERYLFDDYDPTAFQNSIDTQHKVDEYQKKIKIKAVFRCCSESTILQKYKIPSPQRVPGGQGQEAPKTIT